MARHRQPRMAPAHMAPPAPARPVLSERPSQFLLLEREVEDEFRPQMLQALQRKFALPEATAQEYFATVMRPNCPFCHLIGVMGLARASVWHWQESGSGATRCVPLLG